MAVLYHTPPTGGWGRGVGGSRAMALHWDTQNVSTELEHRCICQANEGVAFGPRPTQSWVLSKISRLRIHDKWVVCRAHIEQPTGGAQVQAKMFRGHRGQGLHLGTPHGVRFCFIVTFGCG